MIGKITKGARPGGLGRYLHGPGHRNEHTHGGRAGAMVIGGNLGREGDRRHHGWVADLTDYAKTARGKKPIWQVSLRNDDSDRVLSDDEWAEAGQLMAEDMGYDDRPWVMVRHADDHVHIVMCRQGDTGPMWNDRNDRARMMTAKSKLEERYGLTSVPVPDRHQKAADKTMHKLTQGEVAKTKRTGRIPARVRLAERVRQAQETALKGGGRKMFEQQMGGLGVSYRTSTTKAGKMRGYAFHLEGDLDADGQPIYYPASKLDKSLSWSKLGPELDSAPDLHESEWTVMESLGSRQIKHEAEARADAAAPEPDLKKRRLEPSTYYERRRTKARQQWQADWSQAHDQAKTELRTTAILDNLPRQTKDIDQGLKEAWTERLPRIGKTSKQRNSRTQAQNQAREEVDRLRQLHQQDQQKQREAENQAQVQRDIAARSRRHHMNMPQSPQNAPQSDDYQPGD